MEYIYLITPFIAWFFAGTTKFLINCFKTKRFAFDLIGYGGFPSTHSAIVSSIVAQIAIIQGIFNPVFGVAITMAFIVMIDANGLRRQLGKQAAIINQLANKNENYVPLRERMGHSKLEIFAGVLLGMATACLVKQII